MRHSLQTYLRVNIPYTVNILSLLNILNTLHTWTYFAYLTYLVLLLSYFGQIFQQFLRTYHTLLFTWFNYFSVYLYRGLQDAVCSPHFIAHWFTTYIKLPLPFPSAESSLASRYSWSQTRLLFGRSTCGMVWLLGCSITTAGASMCQVSTTS